MTPVIAKLKTATAGAPVVVSEAGDNTPAVGQLFKDISFFLPQRIPTRSRFVADIEANGGRVVRVEKYADYLIADHMRKPTPAGTFSYTLIEQAIRDGNFPNPADHALGPTADSPRAAGSILPGKRTRTPFSLEDDKALWQWVEDVKAQGQQIKGNEPYKRLEAANPRHTWQAWRDRYVKKLIDRPPPGARNAADGSPDQTSDEEGPTATSPAKSKKRRSKPSVEVDTDGADFDLLWGQAEDIERMDEAMYDDAWAMWAEANVKYNANEWRHIWESEVQPIYRKQRGKPKAKRRRARTSDDENEGPKGATSQKRGKRHHRASTEGDAELDLGAIDEEATGAENAQLADDDDEEAPDDDLAALETWRESTNQNAAQHHQLDGSGMPTSEVDRAVDQQFQAEMNGTTSQHPVKPNEEILTSDANRAADQQIQSEANGSLVKQLQPATTTDEQFDTSEANLAAATQLQYQASKEVSGAKIRQGLDGADDELEGTTLEEPSINPDKSTNPLQALTEANLESQQAQHAEPLTRGVDLPKDDQNKDQSEYVKFLQNVTGQPQDEDAEDAAAQERPASNIPMSSDREVDNAMEDAFDWPSSPQQKRDQPESQEQEFETQLPHARLPLSENHVRNLMPHFDNSSQSFMSQTNGDNHSSQGEYAATAGVLPTTHQQPNGAQDVAWDGGHSMAQPDIFEGLDDINDTHIDLSMPEPEGDFTFTSSPAREHPSADRKNTFTRRPGDVDKSGADSVEAVRRTSSSRNQVVDISSGASSSSAFSSQEAEPLPQPVKTVQAKKNHALETQDILNAETQAPNFFMPLPDDDQDNEEGHISRTSNVVEGVEAPDLSVPLPADWNPEMETGQRPSGNRPARQPKQKQKVVESQTMDVEKELESWLDMQHVRGFSEASAIAAMQRSSMRPDLAELVLLAEKGGLKFPNDVPGIWSEREDQAVESGDAVALRRLEDKHGWDEVQARMQFLAEWREA